METIGAIILEEGLKALFIGISEWAKNHNISQTQIDANYAAAKALFATENPNDLPTS